MVLRSGGPLRDARPLLACLSLGFAVIGALVILFSVVTPAGAQATGCETSRKPEVPGADRQDADCLPDLTTRTPRSGSQQTGRLGGTSRCRNRQSRR